ncbi:MAG TPA: hypothetical protein VKE41_24415 [Roseiflexaceae bacterium]|nr:hypothetical protein [Roseiflexaceae bacterium]
MPPSISARVFTIAHLTCLLLLVVGLLGFGAMVVTNTAPMFHHELALGENNRLEVHNGSACPSAMPSSVCFWTGLAYRHEFRVVYSAPGYQCVLVLFKLPERRYWYH